MKKIRRGFIGLVAVLALGSSGMTSAATCADISFTTWTITCESAFLEPGGSSGFTGPIMGGTLNITLQDPSNCFFLGNISVGTDPPIDLTGATDGSAIRITTADTVVDGRFNGRNRMELTVSVLAPTPSGMGVVNTSLCTATRIH